MNRLETGGRFPPRYLARTYPWLEKQGVKVISGVRYDEVTSKGVKITKDGKQEFIPADTVMGRILPPTEGAPGTDVHGRPRPPRRQRGVALRLRVDTHVRSDTQGHGEM